MKSADEDKVIITEALNNIREKRLELEQRVAEARRGRQEADKKLQIASDELKECYIEIATLKSMKEEMVCNELDLTRVESQCSGDLPALYSEGFAACYW